MKNKHKERKASVPLKKIVIAAGGTGGHLFPAQAVARALQETKDSVMFMGKDLGSNPYFYADEFPYKEIVSSPFAIKKLWYTLYQLTRGIVQAQRALRRMRPRVVIGFGSYHTFPILAAALLCKIPIILFEANAIPGRVNRLFAPWAKFCAVQFSSVQKHFFSRRRGPTLCQEVAMPIWREKEIRSEKEAYSYFSLEEEVPVLLIFGGSQGAHILNQQIVAALALLDKEIRNKWQVIHLVGKQECVEKIEKQYLDLGMRFCVKAFEQNMPLAWMAADGVICRSGASTLAELIAFAVPSILVPYAKATDQHQLHNALFMEKEIQGGVCVEEKDLAPEVLQQLLHHWLPQKRREQKERIEQFRDARKHRAFTHLIEDYLSSYDS